MIDPTWFEGEGWSALAVAATLLIGSALVLLWLRGPGSRPHDPPVARDSVRLLARMLAVLGTSWLVRAVSGTGGFVVVGIVVVIASLTLAMRARARRRRSQASSHT